MRDSEFDDQLRGYLDRRAGRVRPMQIGWPAEESPSTLRALAVGVVVAVVVGAVIVGGFALHLARPQGPPSTGVVGESGTPPARCCAAMAYDPETSQVIMFGGLGTQGDFGDTWVWTGTGWIRPHLALSPHSRDGASMVYDQRLHGLVLIGGSPNAPVGPSERADLAATWLWTGTEWKRLETVHAPAANSVPQSIRAPIAYDAATGRVVMVTTQMQTHFEACSTETWTFDGSDWRLEQPTTALPASVAALVDEPQTGHIIAVLAPRAPVVPRGLLTTSCAAGSDAARALPSSSTWRWTSATWVETSAGTEPGGSRLEPSSNGTVLGLDAISGRAMVLTDDDERVWRWDGARWSALATAGIGPAPRSYSVQSVDRDGHVVLFGGVGEPAGPLGYETWVWDAAHWLRWTGPAPATSSPSPAVFTPAST